MRADAHCRFLVCPTDRTCSSLSKRLNLLNHIQVGSASTTHVNHDLSTPRRLAITTCQELEGEWLRPPALSWRSPLGDSDSSCARMCVPHSGLDLLGHRRTEKKGLPLTSYGMPRKARAEWLPWPGASVMVQGVPDLFFKA